MKYEFTSQGKYTKNLVDYGIHDFQSLLFFVRSLPYGRNANRENLYLVISEGKGTCSSKHAFLKSVAVENNFDDIKLILAIYKMTERDTPKIGSALSENDLDYIPEAHCYLKQKDERVDITSVESDFSKIEGYILEEIEIEPQQVSEFKVHYHKKFLKNWIAENNLDITFEELWSIREKCIENISNSNF